MLRSPLPPAPGTRCMGSGFISDNLKPSVDIPTRAIAYQCERATVPFLQLVTNKCALSTW